MFENKISLRLIPYIKNILYLENIDKRNILEIYDNSDEKYKSKYDKFILEKGINFANTSIKNIKTKNYSEFDLLKKIKNNNLTFEEVTEKLIDYSNTILNIDSDDSYSLVMIGDYIMSYLSKQKKFIPMRGLLLAVNISFMDIKTFTNFIYTIQNYLNSNYNEVYPLIAKNFLINESDEEVDNKLRLRINRSYNFPIRKKVVKNIIEIIKSRYELNNHLLFLENIAITNITTKNIIKNYTL